MSGGNVSKQMVDRVLALLPVTAPGLSFQQIHERIGMWSIISIKHAVRQLKEEGLVVRDGSHQRPEFRRVN